MKIKFTSCSSCFPPTTTEFQFNEDGIYTGACPRGHEINFMTSLPLYEILFSIALQAFKDGYYCETVRAITASLERFQEHFLKIFLFKGAVKAELIDKVWKEVKNQSERQYGAFIIFYTSVCGEVPQTLNDRERAFRNNIIHKGQIAKKEDALEYSKRIFAIESSCLEKLFSKFGNAEKEYRSYLNKERENKSNRKVSYVNWEPIGYIFQKVMMNKALTVDEVLTRDYVI